MGDLLGAARDAVAQSSTTANYASQRANYAVFCARYSLHTSFDSPYHIPATAHAAVTVALAFLSHEAMRGLSSSSLNSAIWGLRRLWACSPPHFADLSVGDHAISRSLKALRAACTTPVSHKLALPPSTLRHLPALDAAEPVAALTIMLGFAFFLRVSE